MKCDDCDKDFPIDEMVPCPLGYMIYMCKSCCKTCHFRVGEDCGYGEGKEPANFQMVTCSNERIKGV